jgi:hypothetical protein
MFCYVQMVRYYFWFSLHPILFQSSVACRIVVAIKFGLIGSMPLQFLSVEDMPLQKTELGKMPFQLSHTSIYAIFLNTNQCIAPILLYIHLYSRTNT